MSNLDATVTTTVDIIAPDGTPAPGQYPTTLTIASGAGVLPNAYATTGVTSSVESATLDNLGSVLGGPGAQVNLLSSLLPPGGIGVYFNGFGSVTNAGTLTGGTGGADTYPAIQIGGRGGVGVDLVAGGALTNTGIITGGAGGAAGGAGGVGGVGGGQAGEGLDLLGGAQIGPTLHNQGTVMGGAGGYGALYGRPGALGVTLSSGATLSNDAGGIIGGGAGGDAGASPADGSSNHAGAGATGIAVFGSSLINAADAIISGGNAGTGGSAGAAGGSGVMLKDGALLDNSGLIHGGDASAGALGGVGVYLDDSTLTTSGMIAGGANGDRSLADAVQFGDTLATLILDPGAGFFGQVAANPAANDVLELAGHGGAAATLENFGSQFTGFSTLVFDPGAAWTVDSGAAAAQALTAIQGFDATDTLDLTDPPFTAGATATFANDVLSIQDGNASLALLVDGSFGTQQFAVSPDGSGADGRGGIDITVQAACYRRGTHIRTARGEVKIEELVVGDLIDTASGGRRALRWLGSRKIECHRYPDPSLVWPIRIRAGAVAHGVPARDLWVSPGHCLYFDGVLLQAEKLVNGASILRVPRARVEYWHLELDRHDIVFAEGLPAESYLDTGNRHAFGNGGAFIEAFPDVLPKDWTDTCAPLVKSGAALNQARARLLARSRELGHAITHDAAVHVIADGERIDPLRLGDQRLVFVIAPGRVPIELRCRTFIPAHTDPRSEDTRALGICVGRLQLDGIDIPLASLDGAGWHDVEPQAGGWQRWTRAHVPLPPGTRLVLIDLAAPSHCWAIPQVTPCGQHASRTRSPFPVTEANCPHP